MVKALEGDGDLLLNGSGESALSERGRFTVMAPSISFSFKLITCRRGTSAREPLWALRLQYASNRVIPRNDIM